MDGESGEVEQLWYDYQLDSLSDQQIICLLLGTMLLMLTVGVLLLFFFVSCVVEIMGCVECDQCQYLPGFDLKPKSNM